MGGRQLPAQLVARLAFGMHGQRQPANLDLSHSLRRVTDVDPKKRMNA